MRATHFLNVPAFIEENPEQSGGRKSAIETEKLSMKKMISWNVNGLRACLGKGFLEYVKESDALMEEARVLMTDVLDNCIGRGCSDWGKIKSAVKDSLGDFIWKKTKRRPMILPIIMEV